MCWHIIICIFEAPYSDGGKSWYSGQPGRKHYGEHGRCYCEKEVNSTKAEDSVLSLPYFKVHPPDYLNDHVFQRLSNEEFGVILKLFMLMWQSNLQLLDDDINVAWQLRMDPQQWAIMKCKFMDFRILFNDCGYLTNSAMKTKYLGAEKFSQQQSEKRKNRKRKQ